MSDPAAAPARLADRYRLVEIVGEGGMAVVWRAEDELLGRTVAVKLLRPQYASDPEFLRRLHSEARAAATLNDLPVQGVPSVKELYAFAIGKSPVRLRSNETFGVTISWPNANPNPVVFVRMTVILRGIFYASL